MEKIIKYSVTNADNESVMKRGRHCVLSRLAFRVVTLFFGSQHEQHTNDSDERAICVVEACEGLAAASLWRISLKFASLAVLSRLSESDCC